MKYEAAVFLRAFGTLGPELNLSSSNLCLSSSVPPLLTPSASSLREALRANGPLRSAGGAASGAGGSIAAGLGAGDSAAEVGERKKSGEERGGFGGGFPCRMYNGRSMLGLLGRLPWRTCVFFEVWGDVRKCCEAVDSWGHVGRCHG